MISRKRLFLWIHGVNDPDSKLDEAKLKIKIVRKALQRQVDESVRIMVDNPTDLMNSMSGFGTNNIPRISVTMGNDVMMKRNDRKHHEEEEKKVFVEKEKEKKEKEVDEDPDTETGVDIYSGQGEENMPNPG